MVSRRSFNARLLAGLLAPSLLACRTAAHNGDRRPWPQWSPHQRDALGAALQALENHVQGRLGVHLIDAASGQQAGYRSDERFLMLSSFKTLSAAYVLARHDRGEDRLDRRIAFAAADLVEWSPVTERHAGGPGLTLAELCHATLTTSDNTAANLLHASYGGPARLTHFVRSLGDDVTRHDRIEPGLNLPHPTEPLDTTTPRAMSATLCTLLFGDALSPASRRLLQAWLEANTTGGKRLRAGLPPDWQVGEKTGTATRVGANDAGFVRPPGGTPLLVSVYLDSTAASAAARDDTLAAVGRLLPGLLRQTP